MGIGAAARGALELTRPVNAVVAGMLTFIGSFVAVPVASLSAVPVAAAVGATVLATGAGNAINDYFDRDIDRINDPDRPIPRGAISPRGALAFSVALFLVAVVVALALLPILAIAIAVVNLAALVTYTELFKGKPGVGNALVAYLGGSTFLFGGAAVGSVGPTVVLFLLAALSTLAREIIKDVEDVAGDREEGLNTLPIAIGERRALQLAAGLLLAAALASPVPYLTGTFGVAYLAVVGPADLVMLAAGYRSFECPSVGQSQLKYGMFLAAAAFVAGRAATVV
ncbi:geranylgeranylglycerol-phosphate geranylgeranyltransferase [Halorientalis litorea]|jgi:geranylgeranylglycerol-phosphate geranylgeranyltransferase|uniref:geranylgeranylglycerol-phosphate geranylgeranyltransferase n=1 Tax=Halorientalis litorea TaxID=2931977 RepID=UPI001FF0EE34|nr:geranylgeranylglycerol-phosphate geranylgeranyltransferase [Halorientalis litorea]